MTRALVVDESVFGDAGTKGPLVEGEEDRARRWGQGLAGLVRSRSVGS